LKNKDQTSIGLSEQKFEQDLAFLEAALYVAGRPLDLSTLGSIINTRSKRKTEKIASFLVQKYKNNGGALEILKLDDNRFVLQLKKEYTSKVRKLAIKPLLTSGPLKTLSYVAYEQRVVQTQVIKARGRHAYAHLKQIEEMGLIMREQAGLTKIIKTTPFFADYFGLSHDVRIMKRQLKTKFEETTTSKK